MRWWSKSFADCRVIFVLRIAGDIQPCLAGDTQDDGAHCLVASGRECSSVTRNSDTVLTHGYHSKPEPWQSVWSSE